MKERITFVEERLSEMSQAAVGQEVRVNDLEATIIRLQHEIESKQKEIIELKAKDESQHCCANSEQKKLMHENSKTRDSLSSRAAVPQFTSFAQLITSLIY